MHRLAGPIERQADTHNPLGPVVSQQPIEQRGDPDRNEISQLWGVYLPQSFPTLFVNFVENFVR